MDTAPQARTDLKLRFAGIHLDELEAMPNRRGDDFERAHAESFLYHLLGVRDAFLAELNICYRAGLPPSHVTPGTLRRALEAAGLHSPELAELFILQNDPGSWFNLAKGMRDHSTHNMGVPRMFHVGGPHDGETWLHQPDSGDVVPRDYVDEFREWYVRMGELVKRLRATARNNSAWL